MKQFTAVSDVKDIKALVAGARQLKAEPLADKELGRDKTLALLFFNPSLRTRLSTQKAGINLGMSVVDMNAEQGWQLEFEDGAVMNADKAEHVREAAAVIAQYADIIGVRTFPSLIDRDKDYEDLVLHSFVRHAGVPVVSLESAVRHPLQSLADVLTIEERKKTDKPKVVLSWAPHPRALPQAVPNSFAEWTLAMDYDLTIAHPLGYELHPSFTQGARITHDQRAAFEGADFIYAKNWSPYEPYGQVLNQDASWQITADKMAPTNRAWFMHCLPVRRNVVVSDAVIDGPQSIVIEQANNRTYAAQAVLREMLRS